MNVTFFGGSLRPPYIAELGVNSVIFKKKVGTPTNFGLLEGVIKVSTMVSDNTLWCQKMKNFKIKNKKKNKKILITDKI